MAKQQKTERQRAEEARDVAQRKVQRLMAAEKHQASLLELTRRELKDAQELLRYRREHPALPSNTPPSTTPTTTKETTTP